MSKLVIHIVEDEVIISRYLEHILGELGHHVDGSSRTYEEVIEKLSTSQADLFLLDIKLDGNKTGIDIGKELNTKKIPFIYISSVTGHKEIELVKETAPYGFIIKPFTKEDVFIAIEMAQGRIDAKFRNQSIFIRIGAGKERVLLKDIMYAQAEGNYTHIFLENRTLTLNDNLKTVHSSLLTHPVFLRVHKSYVVNKENIIKVFHNHLILRNGAKLPKSRMLKIL